MRKLIVSEFVSLDGDELHLLVYPLTLGSGKRVLPEGLHTTFSLRAAKPTRPVSWAFTACASELDRAADARFR